MFIMNVPPEPPSEVPVLIVQAGNEKRVSFGDVVMQDLTPQPREPRVTPQPREWAEAWAAKDVDNYLSFYAPEFKPHHGLTRSAWERQRRNRLNKYRKIEIELSGLTVSLQKNTATVEFVQSFKADGFSETGLHKRLDLELHGTRWMIVKETSGKE